MGSRQSCEFCIKEVQVEARYILKLDAFQRNLSRVGAVRNVQNYEEKSRKIYEFYDLSLSLKNKYYNMELENKVQSKRYQQTALIFKKKTRHMKISNVSTAH